MRTQPFRRTIAVAVLALIGTGLTVAIPTFADAQEEFVNGSGRAKTSVVRVGPSAAQLSLAPALGVSLTDHLGVLGRGESLVIDYAALDGNVQDDVPPITEGAIDPKGKQLPPLRAECTIDRCDGHLRAENVPGVVQEAEAKAKPSGKQSGVIPDGFASASLQAFEIPGVIKVSGGRATSFSGVFKSGSGFVRRAGGTVDIGEVQVGGLASPIVLRGLHWEASQVTDKNDDDTPEITGKFVIGQAIVPGAEGSETHDGPITGNEIKPLFDGINSGFAAMGPIDPGIRLQAPEFVEAAGAARLLPLSISMIDSNLGKTVVGPVVGGAQPARDRLTDGGNVDEDADGVDDEPGYLDMCVEFNKGADPEKGDIGGPFPCGLPLLVGDLAVGVLSGSGRLDLDLGGVIAVTEGQVFADFDLFGGAFELGESTFEIATDDDSGADTGASVLGTTASFDEPAAAPSDSTATPAAAEPGVTEVAAPQVFKLTGSRASAAWAVGLVGLGAALAMAASDYRRLRMRRRAVTPIT